MTQSVAILGRQPALGIAELESLYGASHLSPVGQKAVLLDIGSDLINFRRLGGTLKLAKLLTTLETTDWDALHAWLKQTVPEHLQYLPEGKLQLGLSTYGLAVSVSRINASGLELKKVIRAAGRSVRLIPNKTPELNSAQVLHNKLTGSLGWELLLIRDGGRTHVAQTVAVQDIEAYAARDQARPHRDARVGMLPPKLAQIIINLATGSDEFIASGVRGINDFKNGNLPSLHRSVIHDPFCGTGVVLQEALLMGYDIYGSDLDPRMVSYAKENLNWLFGRASWEIAIADATSGPIGGELIACETYLGRPFATLPKPETLHEVIQDVNTIHRKFLQNVARQTKSGFRLCIAVPAWRTKNGFKHLPVLDQLTDLGYTRTSFVHVDNRELVYHRPEQIVARELITLIRN